MQSSCCWQNAWTYECVALKANVPYDEVFELEDINNDFANADVAFVIGAMTLQTQSQTDPKVRYSACGFRR